ncbi:helix-turn-helix DNA-binding domain protein [Mycobacterium phage Saguaro]|uniref:Helix-turn-helix DNA-binding domain protein n=1 Tax=Mycobacterium phage Saguaro TaxID=2315616 RepID=A0A386K9Z2_9CAUD|nr:helix-turn-helix DNA-binding domain protein [Mycobacterium phage Saguaro]AYD82073.1 helix-turn-helix DNA-binding domain protein [Mycobacterium phage Saguaro]
MSDNQATDGPRFPHVHVELVGQDGNAMSIIGRVAAALRGGGADTREVNQFVNEAMSGDYDNVIATACRWVEVS